MRRRRQSPGVESAGHVGATLCGCDAIARRAGRLAGPQCVAGAPAACALAGGSDHRAMPPPTPLSRLFTQHTHTKKEKERKKKNRKRRKATYPRAALAGQAQRSSGQRQQRAERHVRARHAARVHTEGQERERERRVESEQNTQKNPARRATVILGGP